MKVSRLIELLQEFPEDMEVLFKPSNLPTHYLSNPYGLEKVFAKFHEESKGYWLCDDRFSTPKDAVEILLIGEFSGESW